MRVAPECNRVSVRRPRRADSPRRAIAALALLVAALLALLTAAAAPSAEEGQPVRLSVCFIALGPDAEDGSAQGFVDALDAREGYAAETCKEGTRLWHTPPKGAARERWVSLVMVGFRTRRDWLAFVCDGPEGSVSLALRRPATSIPPKGLRPDEIMPGDKQVSSNAVRELAADLGHSFASRHKGPARERLRIEVEPWRGPEDAGDGVPGLDEGDEAPAPPGLGAGAQEVTAKDVEGVRALVTAAAWTAGFQPTAGNAPRTLKLGLARGVQSYSILATLRGDGREVSFQKAEIPADDLFLHLTALCRKLRVGDGLADFVRVSKAAPRVLAASGQEVVVAAGGALTSWDPARGKVRWELPAPERGSYSYVARSGPDGRNVVYRLGSDLQRVGDQGALTVTAGAVPGAWWAFDVPLEGVAAVAQGPDLLLCRDGTEAGRFRNAVPLSAGPVICGDRVLAGTSDGEMVCVSADGAGELWRHGLGGEFLGPLAVLEDVVLASTCAGTLLAVCA